MENKVDNNQGKNQEKLSVEKNNHQVVRIIIVMLAVIIAYAGYEYFWRSLKMSELVNQRPENTSTTTQKKEVSGEKIVVEPEAPASEKAGTKTAVPAKPVEAKNSGPAVLKITDQGKTFTIGLVIKSDCQTPASGDSVETARKTARLTGLTINGKLSPIKFDQELVCTYPDGVKEAYVPDPRLAVARIDQLEKKVFFSVSGSENQGSGRETVWRNNFFFDFTAGTIK